MREGLFVVREHVGDGFGLLKRSPVCGTQVRRIESAEYAVPVGIVALAAQQQSEGFAARAPEGAIETAAAREAMNFLRDVQHFLVQQVRLSVFREKSAPDTSA